MLRLLPKSDMLPAVGNNSVSGNTLAANLQQRLPEGWSVVFHAPDRHHEVDGWLNIRSPRGTGVRFAVEIKSRFEPRDTEYVISQLEKSRGSAWPLLLAPHLSSRSRELLRSRNISFADANGNMRIAAESLYVEIEAESSEGVKLDAGLPRTSLRGPVTGRIIRFLTDNNLSRPLKVRDIAERTDAHPGNVSKLLALLEREKLIERDDHKSVVTVDWESLIKLWAPALKKDRRSSLVLAPRGIDWFLSQLTEPGSFGQPKRYAITGPWASARLAPAAHTQTIDVYVDFPAFWMQDLKLAESGVGNIRFIEAFDDVVLDRIYPSNDLRLAWPSQIAADLLTLPKRSDDEYLALIAWMKKNEGIWRVA